MAKDNKFYFSHDYNARNDRKIAPLVKDYKSAGYGIYWCTAEMMHEEGGVLDYDDITFSAISKDLNEDFDFVKEVISKCICVYKLFISEDNLLTSNRVKRNLNKREEISDKRRKAAKAKQMQANAQQMQPIAQQPNVVVEQESAKEIKGKEIKGKEIKGKESIIIQPPEEKKTEPHEFKVLPEMTKDDFVLFQSKMIQEPIFIEQVMMAKNITDKSTMLCWIKFFNMHIAGDEKINKDYSDYKRHFKNWFVKQDTTSPPSNGVSKLSQPKIVLP